MKDKCYSRFYRKMFIRLLPSGFFLPVFLLALSRFSGTDIKSAFHNALAPLLHHDHAFFSWILLLAGYISLVVFIHPVIDVWVLYLAKRPIPRGLINKAMHRFNLLWKWVLLICISGYLTGGLFEFLGHSLKDSEGNISILIHFISNLSVGLLTAVVIYMNFEIILFHPKRILIMQQPDIPQTYSPFFRRMMAVILSMLFFMFIQFFLSTVDFMQLGYKGEPLQLTDHLIRNNPILLGRYNGHFNNLLKVFDMKILLYFIVFLRMLFMLKLSLKNPLNTIRGRLSDLASEELESTREITIINNDEFSPIYKEINKLIQRQQGELEQSKIRLHNIVDSAADPIVSFDSHGCIYMFNPAAEKYFKWKREEITGNSIGCIFNSLPEGLSACDEMDPNIVSEILESNNGLRRYESTSKEGDPLQFEANISSNETVQGILYTAVIRDIRGQREFEHNLQTAKDAAEQANRMKSEFLANMSHELRTPLNAILGFTQLLGNERNLSDQQKNKIGIISRSGEHLLGLINDILDISKIEAGKLELHSSVFRLDTFMDDLRDMFELKCQKKGLVLDVEYLTELPPAVEGDLGKLRQVLINLLGNAVKFTREGGISIVVGMDDNLIRFAISDTGKGIPLEEQQSILQPFTQSSNVDNEGGTGLGLAISSQFVKMMGGKMEVESQPGSGSTFSFALDLPAAQKEPELKETHGDVLGIRGDLHPKALIVDDKVNNRLVLKEMLERVGFITMEAEDGEQALERVEQFQPDMVFMDIKMPRKDGYEAVKDLRNSYPELPVFALTASAFKHDEKKIIQSGFRGYLPKPFKQSSLFQLIEDYTEIRFHYYQPETPREALNMDEIPWDSIKSLLENQWLEKLDDLIMINDFLGIGHLAMEMEKQEKLIPLAKIIKSLADSFDEKPLIDLSALWKNAVGKES